MDSERIDITKPWSLSALTRRKLKAIVRNQMMNPKDIVRDGYDKVSRAYRGDAFAPKDDPCYRQCIDMLLGNIADGSRVLDLGCGCGIPSTRDLAAHHQVTGVDISAVQIERAQALVPSAEFLCADMTELNFPPCDFDAVVSLYAIIHVPLEKQPSLLRKVARWLKQDGWLLCIVGHREWTGTEANWLGVPGGTMFWSHTDQQTYERWLTDLSFRIENTVFIPEGTDGHTALLAQKVATHAVVATSLRAAPHR